MDGDSETPFLQKHRQVAVFMYICLPESAVMHQTRYVVGR